MLPLGGDARATIVAYANLGMAGFVVAAICLRFAYPSVSAEGKAFWLMQAAPVSYRELLRVKVLVYGVPLTAMALLLTAVANLLLGAGLAVWAFTMIGASLLAFTLVSLGVGMGALSPNFAAENPLQVGLSLGGFGYMALSLAYVGGMMILMARPIMHYFFWRVFGIGWAHAWVATALPIVTAIICSVLLSAVPLWAAERHLARLSQSG
jgi:ABC-2 type transport system permease protein